MLATFGNHQIQYSPKRYARILDTIEVHKKSRITLIEGGVTTKLLGAPDVWRIDPLVTKGKPQGIQMTKDFQHWIYRINVERMLGRRMSDSEYQTFYNAELQAYRKKTGGQTIRDFNSLFRSKGSHTNHAGVNKYANYIAQERLEEGLPIYSNIVTGRWVGEVVDVKAKVHFKVINASKGYLHYHPFDNPELFDEPLSTGRTLNGNVIVRDDVRRCYNDFGEQVVLPVMLPVDDVGVFPDAVVRFPSDEDVLSKFV